jgi:hypothetical protein
MANNGHSGDYKGRSDYGGGKGKGVQSDINSGDKGIPMSVTKNPDQMKTKGGVSRNVDVGDKGIPPMGESPTSKPILD